jgi:hypothetical protein
MGTPTRFRGYCLRSAALKETELMVGKCAKRIRAVTFHSIRSSGTRRLSPSGRWCEMRPALSRFNPSPSINTDRYIAFELRRP